MLRLLRKVHTPSKTAEILQIERLLQCSDVQLNLGITLDKFALRLPNGQEVFPTAGREEAVGYARELGYDCVRRGESNLVHVLDYKQALFRQFME
jgi:hypothetical protein